ncbi:MAG: hypothetical protein HMLKMBBP_00440 [Planctomycetes bacterium]|nr:hypothetical protein [Planctomycetota bacterium]
MPVVAAAPDVVLWTSLLAAVLLVPPVLARFRVPGAITCLGMGIGLAALGVVGPDESALRFGATLGISTLFLAAGLDVDLRELRSRARMLLQHLAIRAGMLAAVATACGFLFGMEARPALLVALGLITPSAGFILDSLESLPLYHDERVWVRLKVVATELLALGVLVFVTQPSVPDLGIALGSVAAVVALTPVVLRVLGSVVLPRAPKSAFSFLVILSVAAALVTKEVGVYYLVGAFIVGLTARRLRDENPAIAPEYVTHAIEGFASIFVPVYFLSAGATLDLSGMGGAAVAAGFVMFVLVSALRVAAACWHHHAALGEEWRSSARKTVPMLPTLVFTLVVASLLPEGQAPGWMRGALFVYAVLTTLAPSVILPRLPVQEYDRPTVPPPAGGVS